jgi:starch synthase (maltosyl-transferring)
MKPEEGRKRVVIEAIQPRIDCGRYPVRRFLGDRVDISAAIFSDGHDHVAARLLYKAEGERNWRSTPMTALPNDLWSSSFTVDRLGTWVYTIQAWVDHFDTWCADLRKRLDAQPDPDSSDPANRDLPPQDIPLAFTIGAILLDQAATRASASGKGSKASDAKKLKTVAASLRALAEKKSSLYEYPLSPEFESLASAYPDPSYASTAKELRLWVDRERARFSSWYELFPRSTSPAAKSDRPDPSCHGTLADVEHLLPEIAAMGFDILYLPPIHPIGAAFRKGPNNTASTNPADEGSPWAIGSPEGGHKAIHSKLGTFADFDHLVASARANGMELALDIAFQCSPDHPWVKEHPDWFLHRPDGTIQYAENPPKKYQDIYPLNFESSDWQGLWDELRSVFQFWIARGVRVFRVDNPHTKALPFWEWCIADLHTEAPDVIFLAEAFTRPHVMYSLAKGGFTQSYTYFTWRTEKDELQAYFEEIAKPPVSDFFTPNVWPNTPDILHASLQDGGRPAFMQRVILATTLAASYGIYGPAFELCENVPAKPRQRRVPQQREVSDPPLGPHRRPLHRAAHRPPQPDPPHQPRAAERPLAPLPQRRQPADHRLLQGRRRHRQRTRQRHPHRRQPRSPFNEQAGWVDLDLKQLGIGHDEFFDVEDLLTGIHYQWHDRSNYVALRPSRHARPHPPRHPQGHSLRHARHQHPLVPDCAQRACHSERSEESPYLYLLLRLSSHLRRLTNMHLDPQPCPNHHIHQALNRKQIDLAPHKVRNPRLCDAKQLGSLALGQSLGDDMILQRNHQSRAQLHLFVLCRRVFDRVPYILKHFIHTNSYISLSVFQFAL